MPPRNYWLFKSEPNCFSIDDLSRCRNSTEHWDGVRNYQARNYLRDDIQEGDGVLFYHSNIPEPAIAGVAEVVKGGYPDWTARNPDGEHFDPRSSESNPIWYMVDIRFVRKFSQPVTLTELKADPALAGMVLLSRSRLSIQPVKPDEWQHILRLGGIIQKQR